MPGIQYTFIFAAYIFPCPLCHFAFVDNKNGSGGDLKAQAQSVRRWALSVKRWRLTVDG
jgi:hypothetical protein